MSLVFSIFSPSAKASAEAEHYLIQRFAVFPLEGISTEQSDKAWWKIREILTQDKKYSVASRRYMQNRKTFQPRGEIALVNRVLLAENLDAHAIVTCFVKDHALWMKVYDGRSGKVLWEGNYRWDSLQPLSEQLETAVTKLTHSFYASIPYQGYIVKDSLRDDKVVYESKGGVFAKVFIGDSARIDVNDPVYFFRLFEQSADSLFQGGGNIQVHLEGVVTAIKEDFAIVELKRSRDVSLTKEHTLVQFPKEDKRLRKIYSPNKNPLHSNQLELLSRKAEKKQDKKRVEPTSAAVAFLLTLATVILLAF